MPISAELEEVAAIRAAFDVLVAHGTPTLKDRIEVSVTELVALGERIGYLYAALAEVAERLPPSG